MPKRKRGDPGQSNVKQEIPLDVQQKRFQEKLHHGIKSLQRALKIAKGFERQKQSKRLEKARQEKNGATVERLDAEADALKTIDLSSIAKDHLYKIVVKDKTLKVSPALPDFVQENATTTVKDDALANVAARLFNTKAAKDSVASTLTALYSAIGIKALSMKTPRPRAIASANNSLHGEVESGEAYRTLTSHVNGSGNMLDDLQHDGDFPDSEYEVDGSEAFETRVVDSSEEEIRDIEDDHLTKPYNTARGRGLTPSPSASERSTSPIKAQSQNVSDRKTTNSNFLPSLSMGGYWSGSESEPEDEDVSQPLRKNRRGQRARQSIWEQKYGSRARHLQKPKSKGDRRDDGWDLKKGAKENSSGSRSRSKAQPHHGEFSENKIQSRGQDGTRNERSDFRNQNNGGQSRSNHALHPSWEAAKKAKEQKQSATFVGKRLTFD